MCAPLEKKTSDPNAMPRPQSACCSVLQRYNEMDRIAKPLPAYPQLVKEYLQRYQPPPTAKQPPPKAGTL